MGYELEFLVVSYALLGLIIVFIILGSQGKNEDIKNRRIKVINQEIDDNPFKELNDSFVNRIFVPILNRVSKALDQAMNNEDKKRSKAISDAKTIERQLRLSGVKASVQGFQFFKTAFMSIVVVITLFIALILDIDLKFKLLVFLFGLVIGMMGPTLFLRLKVSSHQSAIRLQIPDAMDLLGTCIEAGLSFDASLLKVAEKMEGPFIDELLIVYNQIQMGKTRSEALHSLADGSDIPELKTFVAALIQANQLGIPINNVMKIQSEQLRDTRRQLAKEKGAKAPVKMMIPMLIFIFPCILVIVMGPTILQLLDMLT
ncbi:MAG: type II secretion system F family protein [Eubacterium sp.]